MQDHPNSESEIDALAINAAQTSFRDAVERDLCLFSCDPVSAPAGADMRVCGAPRCGSGQFTRYCSFHAKASIGVGTLSERRAERTAIFCAGPFREAAE